MSAFQILHMLFPETPENDLLQALEEAQYDVDEAVRLLTEQTRAPAADLAADGRQVCRHYMAGECRRSDCWFSHDLSGIVCRFWLTGTCLNGRDCPFSHRYSAKGTRDLSTPARAQDKPPGPDEFPTLAGRPSLKAPPSSLDNAKIARLKRLKQEFFWVPSAALSGEMNSSASLSDDTLRERLRRQFRRSVNVAAPAAWVETGKSVEREYLGSRADAIKHAELRNKYFQLAADAYRRGDRAGAKELSRQGRLHNEAMQELHQAACQSIFSRRNAHLENEAMIDLHGLHILEALRMLDAKLDRLRERRYRGFVYVITGTGHHAYQGAAKLLPAVQRFLCENGYDFFDCSADKLGGMLAVNCK